MLHNCKGLVVKVQFLANAHPEAINDLVQLMKYQIYFPGDHIIQAGAYEVSLYFFADVRMYRSVSTASLVARMFEVASGVLKIL